MPTYAWEEGMGEISGFGADGPAGERYETKCRAMVAAGMGWLNANPDTIPLHQSSDFRSVMLEAADDDCTYAMYSKCADICFYIRDHGWAVYVATMRGQKETD